MPREEAGTVPTALSRAHPVRKPLMTELPQIAALIATAAQRQQLLPRSEDELSETVRDFHVYVDEQGVGGCSALHIDLDSLAEIRSLVVRDGLRGNGVGRALLEACVREAESLHLARVYALTRVPGFFERYGFRIVGKEALPQKVFRDCIRCALFFNCDEIAVVRDLVPAGGAMVDDASD